MPLFGGQKRNSLGAVTGSSAQSLPRREESGWLPGIQAIWHEKSYGHCESFMRILVFMTPTGETSVLRDAFRTRFCGRWIRWIAGVVVYAWVAASTQAMVNSPAFQSRPESLNVVTSTLSVIPGQETFYPVLGLLAAVASTYFLRRRRLAQLEATAAAER